MPMHQFAVRAKVRLIAGTVLVGGSRGSYQVTRQLPASGGKYSYRIKSTEEAFERCVTEDQLVAEGAAATTDDPWKRHDR